MKKKIAILGIENTHAWGFAQLISEGKFPDLEIVGVYGTERELKEFDALLKTGKPRQTLEDLTKPVFVIDATIKSYESGKAVEIGAL